MENSSTQALEEALRWQRLIAKTGKTPEQKARAAERIKRLEACLEVCKGSLDGR